MFNTFDAAKNEALKTINSKYDGNKMNCVVVESKLRKNARDTFFGFHFHDTDTNGEFVQVDDGRWEKRTLI